MYIDIFSSCISTIIIAFARLVRRRYKFFSPRETREKEKLKGKTHEEKVTKRNGERLEGPRLSAMLE